MGTNTPEIQRPNSQRPWHHPNKKLHTHINNRYRRALRKSQFSPRTLFDTHTHVQRQRKQVNVEGRGSNNRLETS